LPAEQNLSAPCKARRVWAGEAAIFLWATCLLQFAKASFAAALSQQEKKNSADMLWVRLNSVVLICTEEI
jgi:hypothetical protein